MTFAALEAGLQFKITVHPDSGVAPAPKHPPKLAHLWALVTTIPGHPETDSRDPETEIGSLETEKRVHRIRGTLEAELQRILHNMVAPTRGGRRTFSAN